MIGAGYIWCEHCRDHYPEDHYGPGYGNHKVGREYGPTGRSLELEQAVRRFIDAYPGTSGTVLVRRSALDEFRNILDAPLL